MQPVLGATGRAFSATAAVSSLILSMHMVFVRKLLDMFPLVRCSLNDYFFTLMSLWSIFILFMAKSNLTSSLFNCLPLDLTTEYLLSAP